MDREDQLGKLADELTPAIEAGETLDFKELAERFELPASEVERCALAVQALHTSMDEDLSTRGGLQPPALPSDFELRGELGRGGMGIVYRVHQRSLNREVALKVLRPGDLLFGDAIERFEREARSLARLRHRHIVSVHEVGHAEGFLYFTMDLIDGGTLGELVADDMITTTQAVRLLRQVASAMAFAHGRGVVHRDLKPANILVDGQGDAFVVDFGLARDLGAAAAMTLTGQLIGTPSYMSPEQALGDTARIGESSDIYALGAILYECLTRQAPFAGKPLAQLMHAVIEDVPPAPRKLNPRVPRDLEVICEKAMAKRPEDRYATVQAFSEDLERFAGGQAILARPPSRLYRMGRFAWRHKHQASIVLASAVLALWLAWCFVLPPLLQAYQIRLGDRLLAEGSASGALFAYRTVFETEDPREIDIELRIRYAGLLIDEAGRKQWLEGDTAKPEYDRLLAEADSILGDANRFRHASEDDRRHARDTAIERERLETLRGNRWRATFVNSEYAGLYWERVRDALSDVNRRPAALIQIAGAVASASAKLGKQGANALCEIIRSRRRLPSWARTHLDELIRGRMFFWAPPFSVVHDDDFEAAIVGIIRDTSVDLESRTLAAAAFHKSGPFPVCLFKRRMETGGGFTTVNIVQSEELDRISVGFEQLQGLDRNAAYRLRVKIAAVALFESITLVGDAKLVGWDIMHWIMTMTGVRPFIENHEAWEEWWRQHGAEDPRRWLLRALAWDIEPDAVTVNALMDRLRRAHRSSNANAVMWIHNLLVLTVADNIIVPRRPTIGVRDHVVRWEEALGRIPKKRYQVRIITIALGAGDPMPQVIWSKRFELGIGEETRWQESNDPDVNLPFLHVGLGGSRVKQSGWFHHHGYARSRWTRDGIEISCNVLTQRVTPNSSIGATFLTARKLRMGSVDVVGGNSERARAGQAHVTFLSFATLEETGGQVATDDTFEWWRTALIRRMRNAVETKPRAWTPSVEAAMFLPLPEARETLAVLAEQAKKLALGEEWSVTVHRARLMAGDSRALALEFGEHRNDQYWDPNDYWCRLAITTDDEAIRDHAFEQLEKKNPRPIFLNALGQTEGLVDAMPQTLARRVTASASVFGSYLMARLPTVLVIGLMNLIAGVSLLGIWLKRTRSSTRRSCAFGLLFAALALRFTTVQVNTFVWIPDWTSTVLCLIGIWVLYWRVVSSRWWLLVPTVWTASVALPPTEQGNIVQFYMVAGVMIVTGIGYLCPNPKPQRRRRGRSA